MEEEALRELVDEQSRQIADLLRDAHQSADECGDWRYVGHYWRSIANAAGLLDWAARELHALVRARSRSLPD